MTASKTPVELDTLTWSEARDAAQRGAGVLVTVTSTEQHGHHLPLGTDAFTGHAIALAASAGLDLVVAPVIAYGYRSRPLTGGGQRFPGTVSLRGATLVNLLTDILNELRRTGWKRIAVLAHHMENQNFVYEAAYEAVGPEQSDGTRIMVIEDPYPQFSAELSADLYPNGPPGLGLDHAAIVETALLLHLRPEVVRLDLMADDAPARVPGYDMLPIPDGFTSASGVLSETVAATPELGRRCFEEITTYLHALLHEGLFSDHRSNGAGAGA
jgi:creatinine amidohydrolase